jgi:hypothetical protein
MRDSRVKLTSSIALENDSFNLRSENENLKNQIGQLQTELRKRETSVYELVNRTHDLSEKLNDKTTENNRLNKKILSALSTQTDLKSRFIESLKKLKNCRNMLKLSLEVTTKYSSALTSVIKSLRSGDLFDLDQLQAIFKKLKNNDFKFSMGTQDYMEALKLIDRSELKNLDELKATYQATFNNLQTFHLFDSRSGDEKTEHSHVSLPHAKMDSSYMNISLMHNTKNFDKALTSISNYHPCKCHLEMKKSSTLKSAGDQNEGLLSINESDDPSIENDLPPANGIKPHLSPINGSKQTKLNVDQIDESFHLIASNNTIGRKVASTIEAIKNTRADPGDLSHSPHSLKNEIKRQTISYAFFKQDSVLSYLFVNHLVCN